MKNLPMNSIIEKIQQRNPNINYIQLLDVYNKISEALGSDTSQWKAPRRGDPGDFFKHCNCWASYIIVKCGLRDDDREIINIIAYNLDVNF